MQSFDKKFARANLTFKRLDPSDFTQIVALGNHVHGSGYLTSDSIQQIYEKSWQNDINASWVAFNNQQLIGFRLTYAPGNWQPDKWCSPNLWEVKINEVCYFKCNTVAAQYRGTGIGSQMLSLSIESARKQGATAGLAHIWLASPGNSAYRYFSSCGGKLVKEHENKWQEQGILDNYLCPICGNLCTCTAAEMILQFSDLSNT